MKEENIRYSIKFTEAARADLQSIKKYLYDNNQSAAQKVVEYIINQITTVIAVTPSAGRAGRLLGTRELVITKYPYIIPYQVRNNVIYILRVLHSSRKWEHIQD